MTEPLKRLLFAIAAFLLVFSRRPDALLRAQFWAEDGRVWYADAYNHGIAYSLLTPEAGYFQTFSRLVGIVSQAVPLSYAPLLYNLSAISLQVVIAAFIASRRLERAIPQKPVRLLIAFVYLALPHAWEVFSNITNSQWHLALLAFLVIAAAPPIGRAWHIFDALAVCLSALTGPFCLILVPVAALKYWHRRESWKLVLLGILAAGAVLQTLSLLSHTRPSSAPLGADLATFLHITGRHLFASAVLGGRGYIALAKFGWLEISVLTVANILGIAGAIYCFVRGPIELRMLILFSLLIVTGALVSPAVSPDRPQWLVMATDNTALRYWFIPNFCLFVSLIYLAARGPHGAVRAAAGLLLAVSLTGIAADWRIPPYKDLDFQIFAAAFKNAPAGEPFEIPINPDWKMTLIKK